MPLRLVLAYIIILLYSPIFSHAWTFEETWDDGDGFSGWKVDRCTPYNFTLAQAPEGLGQAVRIENRLHPCGSAEGHAAARIELTPASTAHWVPYGEDWWWRQRVYIPADFPHETLPVSWLTVMQVNVGNKQLGFDPDWKLVINKDLTWRWLGPGGGTIGAIRRGRWTEWLFYLRRSTGSDGVTDAWMDGVQVVNHRGKSTFAAIGPAMPRFGMYATESSVSRTYVLYFDDIVMGPERLQPGGPLGPGETSPPAGPLPAPTGLRVVGSQ